MAIPFNKSHFLLSLVQLYFIHNIEIFSFFSITFMDPNRLLSDWIVNSTLNNSSTTDLKKLRDTINLVNQWLSTTHDSAISRPLFQNLPELCASLFGSIKSKRGLFHSQYKDLPVNIFKPQNIFILKLIYFQYDNSLSFCISPEILPVLYFNLGIYEKDTFIWGSHESISNVQRKSIN